MKKWSRGLVRSRALGDEGDGRQKRIHWSLEAFDALTVIISEVSQRDASGDGSQIPRRVFSIGMCCVPAIAPPPHTPAANLYRA